MRTIAILLFITKTKTYNFKESILCRPQYCDLSTIDFLAFQQI